MGSGRQKHQNKYKGLQFYIFKMPRKKGMKLDCASKLYICLYCVCFLLTFLISVPMLIHVTPQSECLLFVTPYIEYGPSGACNFVGYAPILVAVATVVLIILHVMQLRSLKSFLRQPGPHSSNYHHRPTHIFWRMVVFHGVVTGAVLVIAAIITSGYVTTCENLHQEVWTKVRKRVEVGGYGGQDRRQNNYDTFANDRSIDRYTNNNRDYFGNNQFERSITCRNILTDPENHYQLKEKHAENPNVKAYYGFWYGDDGYADVGDIRYLTYRNNMILEITLAGSWISFTIWLIMLLLMVKERHHLKAHLTDESMWGSEFGGASRRSVGSRMSNQSFDKMSGRYSNQSGSRYSHSRHQPRNDVPPSLNGSYVKPNLPPNRQDRPLATSQASAPPPPPIQQNSLLNYFSESQHEADEIVDVDAAINGDSVQNPDASYLDTQEQDTSFGSDRIPVGLDQSDGWPDNDPIPLGDEVSMGVISRESENYRTNHSTPAVPMPTSNSNRVQGRRGGLRGGGGRSGGHQPSRSAVNGFPQPPSGPPEANISDISYSYRSIQRERIEVPVTRAHRNPNHQALNHSSSGYRTQLGNQSMI